MQDVRFIITGGTIDSIWSPSNDTVVVKEESSIPSYIDTYIKPNCKISYSVVAMKDSRDITKEIQSSIVDIIEKSSEECFVITHGTYTMADTAKYIQEHLSAESSNKKIILTGAFYPLDGFAPNDAGFNLGFAIAASQFVSSGVYVAMNAEIFDASNVTKDIKNAHFAKI